MHNLYQFVFVKGGPVMYPIVLGSIAALALFIERLIALRRERIIPSGLHGRALALLQAGKLDEARQLCQSDSSALANIICAGLKDAGRPRAELRETINDRGRTEVARMEEHVELLGTIAAVEPLLGLLGTVTGLIKAFQAVEMLAGRGAGVNPGALASGIWESLMTTAAGLMVGIPAYAAYRYIQSRIENLTVEMEETALDLMRAIDQKPTVAAETAA